MDALTPDPTNTERRTAPTAEMVLEENLKKVTGYAKHQVGNDFPGFSALDLVNPAEGPDYPLVLDHDCDSENRAMLDKLYELSHVDRDAADTSVWGDPDGESYGRKTLIPTIHGFNFVEYYAQHGDWKQFRVTYSADAGSLIS